MNKLRNMIDPLIYLLGKPYWMKTFRKLYYQYSNGHFPWGIQKLVEDNGHNFVEYIGWTNNKKTKLWKLFLDDVFKVTTKDKTWNPNYTYSWLEKYFK